jgi:hydroxymethylpyrimidine/phosphomethylpyrimidine kinase
VATNKGMIPVALTIAGSDPSGGAGIQADLKTFQAHGVYGEAVIALLTVQDTHGVREVSPVSERFIAAQLEALWGDIPPLAAKTGALASAEAMRVVADAFRGRDCPLVVDPVLRPTAGAVFSGDDALRAFREWLLPVATLVTPNADEAQALTGLAVTDVDSALRAAQLLVSQGTQAVLIKGGHFAGDPTDVLVAEDGTEMVLRAPRIATRHTHGTGCTYSAAITAQLALGRDLASAVRRAKTWLARVIESPLGLGKGRGPLNHFVPVRDT